MPSDFKPLVQIHSRAHCHTSWCIPDHTRDVFRTRMCICGLCGMFVSARSLGILGVAKDKSHQISTSTKVASSRVNDDIRLVASSCNPKS